jgi:anti-sigma B factor antagonist
MSADASLFGVRVVHHNSHTVVRVQGELDLAVAPQLRSRLGNLIADADGAILLDLADVTFIDSTGLCAILTANRELDERHRELRVVKASVQVRRFFELCGITDLIGDPPAAADSAMSA